MNHMRHVIWLVVLLLIAAPVVYAQGGSGTLSFGLENPFRFGNSLYEFIKALIDQVILPIGGVIVVVYIIYSGYLFVTAAGNESQIRKARDNFVWVVVGTAVLLGAWLIARAIENTINNLRS